MRGGREGREVENAKKRGEESEVMKIRGREGKKKDEKRVE